MPGSVSKADIYGGRPPGTSRGDVLPPASQAASGKMVEQAPKAPVGFWLGFVALLVAMRLAWEFGG